MIECQDGSLYTGYTTDVNRRMIEHQTAGPKTAKYVKAKGFHSLQYVERFDTKSAAMKREYEIKSWVRTKKLHLISSSQSNFLNQFE